MHSYFFKSALLPQGWCKNVRATTENGFFKTVELGSEPQSEDQCLSTVIPALPNVHSHVFQRAMAGLSEYTKVAEGNLAKACLQQDNFWSWRELMYQLANQLDSKTLYDVAKKCYSQMLEAGYASVCEFHYVHRNKSNHEDFFTHSEVLLKAANDVGLPITLLPVLYSFAAVGDVPLNPKQQRFELTVEEYIELYKHLEGCLQPNQKLGICFHSIRAVNIQQMQAVIEALPNHLPIHIHIAEQQAEVDQAVEHYGDRPVSWLFDHFDVDHRWSLVHATHLDEREIKLISDSGAVVVLCPLTEANLGDGIFPMPTFKEQSGVWGIGSDSHIEIQPQQELKMLEYSQRLQNQQRNVCCDAQQPHVGTWMWLQAVAGGNQACQLVASGIQADHSSRVIDLQSSQGVKAEKCLDSWVFSDQVNAMAIQL